MVFSSAIFLFLFLPLVLISYWAAGKTVARNAVLLLFSLFFYAWGEAGYVVILLISVFVNYRLGLQIAKRRGGSRRIFLTLAVVFNVAVLGYYKYANFVMDNINWVFEAVGMTPVAYSPVHLPLGISFFTFQAISYVVDIYRRVSQPQRSLFGVALYISMFPQLVAGPIVRYNMIEQALSRRVLQLADVADGARRFVIGLAKKLLIANGAGEIADTIFETPAENLSPAVAWLGAVCYGIQIYFDFSGYSDMAIGLGRMFGFRYPENFAHPYVSTSLQEFWRRWHMTLSSWFRDYVYIPLGGNRCSPVRHYLNLVTVFFLTGLWHGASWTFIVWGMFHGGFLILERLGLTALLLRLPAVVGHAYLLLVVSISWVFFRSDTLSEAGHYLGAMVGANPDPVATIGLLSFSPKAWFALFAGVLFSMPLAAWTENIAWRGRSLRQSRLVAYGFDACLVGLLLVSAVEIASGTYNPFIYFRF